MKKTERKSGYFFWYAPRVLLLIVALFGTAAFFIYSDIIGRAFQSVAKLETDPHFTGGRISETIYDPVGDDNGFGRLTYPTHHDFAPGALDLVRYTIHEPVYNARWTKPADYWQIDLSFSAGPSNVRNIRIYIDTYSGQASGNEPRDSMAEGVLFDAAYPWDYVVAVHGTESAIESFDGTLKETVSVFVSKSGKDMTLRIPLSNRRLQRLYTIDKTAHYVCIGGWTPWGSDGFVPVLQKAASGTGGGATSALTPKIYDCLVPEGKKQEEILSAWNDDALSIPVLEPVIVKMHAASNNSDAAKKVDSRQIEKLEKMARDEDEDRSASLEAKWETALQALEKNRGIAISAAELYNIGLTAFQAGKRAEAEKVFENILARKPDDSTALAYKGALSAMRARDASPLAAVEIIAESYKELDRAVSLAATPEEIITARLSRANVSKSVPDTVFGKAIHGAEDFLAAAEEYRKLDASGSAVNWSAETADAYFNAALCFGIAGKESDAGLWFREAARLVSKSDTAGIHIPARLRLELAKRGFQ